MQTAQQVQNIRHAITVMERVRDHEASTGKKWLQMCSWQTWHNMGVDNTFIDKVPTRTEDDAHKCGMQACFGGWIGMAKEFQAQGVYPSPVDGQPLIGTEVGTVAHQSVGTVFEKLFGWNREMSESITLHSKNIFFMSEGLLSSSTVTPSHIIGWLEKRLIEAIASQPKANLFLTAEELVATEANEAIEKAKGSPINHQLPEVGVPSMFLPPA